ncbi:hypothetical protein FOPG_18825 [Fusarium oxysporum f. sp. conglutinans race 2 54008]|uniref:Uncharacterized protein n=1 Tax=Fusarium oxysporum f. sp. conglutinans race 2 54008 TaxID=1089457 RepID=X0HUU8_FUSOX|nr:hypothetical protein FOPG_18825 [Fusarium oxysporum f. sp. conglutinans race 2 54008]
MRTRRRRVFSCAEKISSAIFRPFVGIPLADPLSSSGIAWVETSSSMRIFPASCMPTSKTTSRTSRVLQSVSSSSAPLCAARNFNSCPASSRP